MHILPNFKRSISPFFWGVSLSIFEVLTGPVAARADDTQNQSVDVLNIRPSGNLQSGTLNALTTSKSIYTSILSLITAIAGMLAVFYLVYAGILYITSSGSPEKTKAARATIIQAVFGIIIITCAYAIISIGTHLGGFVSTIH